MSRNNKNHKPTFGSRVIRRLEHFATALENQEPISEVFTVRKVRVDFKPSVYSPGRVKKTRHMLGVNQAVFARLLGISEKTVRAWERGITTPAGIAARFLDEIRLNPDYWTNRLEQVAVQK